MNVQYGFGLGLWSSRMGLGQFVHGAMMGVSSDRRGRLRWVAGWVEISQSWAIFLVSDFPAHASKVHLAACGKGRRKASCPGWQRLCSVCGECCAGSLACRASYGVEILLDSRLMLPSESRIGSACGDK